MPTIPTVFRSIRKNDVTHKPFKAYKHYKITNSSYESAGYRLQKAYHVGLLQTLGDTSTFYETNNSFNSINNMHVVWNSLDHKYYRYPYDPARTLELTDITKNSKNLYVSASTIAMPYGTVGERIKPGSLSITSTVENFGNLSDYNISLYDDKNGNLKDSLIDSASFAKKENCKFYLSFNQCYRHLLENVGLIDSKKISCKIDNRNDTAVFKNVFIRSGVQTHAGGSDYIGSGAAGRFTTSSASYIKLEDNKIFNNFNRCDEWAFSFWISPESVTHTGTILSKGEVFKRTYYDKKQDMLKTEDFVNEMPIPGTGNFDSFKTPFQFALHNEHIHFQSSDGSNQLHISASAQYRNNWMHVALTNDSASICRFYINGIESGQSGSLPRNTTGNIAYTFIGSKGETSASAFLGDIAEVRMYDYNLSNASIISLSNQNFYSGSLYQSSIPGNVFYRNGQIVISSPLKKYDNIFVSSSNLSAGNFNINYRGTHTIYENEVMVRVPKDASNVSMNPSSTYNPPTGYDNVCTDAEKYNGPGQYRKTMFLSGSAFPYITTIGLYDDKARLLAVGKLAEPVQKRNDIDMNFVVRWDY